MKRISTEGLAARERAAGNGLVDRRFFLSRATRAGASAGAFGWLTKGSAQAEPLSVAGWSKEPGSPFVGYGQPSHFEAAVAY